MQIVETYTLPAYWAPALINGDETGMEEDDIKDLEDWLERVNPGPCVGCGPDSWYSWENDSGNRLGGDVMEFYFLIVANPRERVE